MPGTGLKIEMNNASQDIVALFLDICRALHFDPKCKVKATFYDDASYDFGLAVMTETKNWGMKDTKFVVEFLDLDKTKARDNEYFEDVYRAMGAVVGHILAKRLPKLIENREVQLDDKYRGTWEEI